MGGISGAAAYMEACSVGHVHCLRSGASRLGYHYGSSHSVVGVEDLGLWMVVGWARMGMDASVEGR